MAKKINSLADLNDLERAMLDLLAQGYKPGEIAYLLKRKVGYIKHFFEKYEYEDRSFFNRIEGIKSDPELIAWWHRQIKKDNVVQSSKWCEQLTLATIQFEFIKSRMRRSEIELTLEEILKLEKELETTLSENEDILRLNDLYLDFLQLLCLTLVEKATIAKSVYKIESANMVIFDVTRKLLKYGAKSSTDLPIKLAETTKKMYCYSGKNPTMEQANGLIDFMVAAYH